MVENTVGKKEIARDEQFLLWEKEKLFITSNFSFSNSVLEQHVLQACKKQGLFWEELNLNHTTVSLNDTAEEAS